MANEKIIIPEPSSTNTDSHQSREPLVIPEVYIDSRDKGIAVIPEALDKVSAINPKFFGGHAQSQVFTAIYLDKCNQFEDLAAKYEKLQNQYIDLQIISTNQQVQLGKNEVLIDTRSGYNIISMVANVIGVGLIGLSFNMQGGSEEIASYADILIKAGVILIIIGWLPTIGSFIPSAIKYIRNLK